MLTSSENKLRNDLIRAALDKLEIKPTDVVLQLHGSAGYDESVVSRYHPKEVIAIVPNPENIRRAKETCKQIIFLTELEKEPTFSPDSIDIITAFSHDLPDEKIIGAAINYLKPNGYLVIVGDYVSNLFKLLHENNFENIDRSRSFGYSVITANAPQEIKLKALRDRHSQKSTDLSYTTGNSSFFQASTRKHSPPHNKDFYEHLPPAELDNFSLSAGISGTDHETDVEAAKEFLPKNGKIAVLGAGHSRETSAILKHYQEQDVNDITIDAVEINEKYVKVAKKKFKNDPRITIHQQDMRDFVFKEPYDAILMMWCVVFELKPLDRKYLFNKIFASLAQNGVFICELPPEDLKQSNIQSEDEVSGEATIKTGDKTWTCFPIKLDELKAEFTKNYKDQYGLELTVKEYKSNTDTTRRICVFKKSLIVAPHPSTERGVTTPNFS